MATFLSRSMLGISGLVLSAAMLGGCVNQGEYDRMYETNSALSARNAELQRERDEARTALTNLQKTYSSSSGATSELQRQNDELRRLLAQAQQDLTAMEAGLAQLNFGPLPAEVSQALTALADQYPDLVKFDAARGMLRFAADLTFDSGSDNVKDQAKQALGALAQILTSSAASSYDVVIEGHTDSQRISQPSTRQKHPTNRHLSAHRSISVIEELIKMGVQPERTMAAGWGEYRPAVPNAPGGNTPANRRVEIFLVKGTGAAPAATPAPLTNVTPTREETPTRPVDISK